MSHEIYNHKPQKHYSNPQVARACTYLQKTNMLSKQDKALFVAYIGHAVNNGTVITKNDIIEVNHLVAFAQALAKENGEDIF